ncbi:MAG: ABC transporter ATP-binding protein [Bacillota bacterium]|nr:ABC transporter ATP-binding protein [Bacillota bacterium]
MNTRKLIVKNLSKTFPNNGQELSVLEDISLYVQEGEFVTLLGPSGSGKSTLFKVIAGLIKADQGSVIIDSKEVTGEVVKLGYMPQQDLLLPWRTLLENASLPLLVQGKPKQEAYQQVKELLPVFGLEGFEGYYPEQLSGGMRQRAAMLRTILIDSQVMLLDEPFGALDALSRERLQEWLLEIWEKFKRSVLFITHSIDEAIYLSDRIYVISDRPSQIVIEQAIKIPRPRKREIVTTPQFVKYKQILMEALK